MENNRSTNSQGGKPWALVSLPPFPAVALRVLKLLDQNSVGMRELTDLIRADPAFSSELLTLANAALFAFRTEIKSVQQAAVLLGLQRVKALALTVGMKVYLLDAVKIPALRGCWRHSVACALLAEELARISLMETEFPYVAGMIHDIGRLALAVINPRQYSDLLATAEESPLDVLQRERELFGVDHCEAGRWLVEAWKLPKEFQHVTAHHHAESDLGRFDIVGLVHWGCQMADTLGFAAVRPLQPCTFRNLLECLPDRERRMFNPDPEQLALKVAAKINSLE